ncbi:MAG TPA: BrxE family protein [Thermoleophilia bacterium]|nr:BrxE family protein [Thermoleophilia bacterium]
MTEGLDDAVKLVLAVARLGELDLTGWWGSHGLDRTGRYVLSRSFRRTWRSAALELDVEAAARRHDVALGGRRTALHLFSDEFPFRRWAGAWLAEQKTVEDPSSIFAELTDWDMTVASASIGEWSGTPPRAEVVGDGLRIGALARAELDDAEELVPIAKLLAATYLTVGDPFRAPYFDLQA